MTDIKNGIISKSVFSREKIETVSSGNGIGQTLLPAQKYMKNRRICLLSEHCHTISHTIISYYVKNVCMIKYIHLKDMDSHRFANLDTLADSHVPDHLSSANEIR